MKEQAPDSTPTETSSSETLSCDVLIVGAGPAGLAAAIRLKQCALDSGRSCSVIVLEKAAEVGGHSLSGAVLDPSALDALLPDWRVDTTAPIRTAVTEDSFFLLGPAGALKLPSFLLPPPLHNRGNFIISLGQVCRWLAQKAEALGVEIYPGFPAVAFLYGPDGSVRGVKTGAMGIDRHGLQKSSYIPGMELQANYVFLAEGARGSLSKVALSRYGLTRPVAPQKFGLGLKEIWKIPPAQHKTGRVQHMLGWPLGRNGGGGGFLYHLEDGTVSVGLVVHLDYTNPYLSPFEEFQRFKTHPLLRAQLGDGERLAYGARSLTEGGWQSVPRLCFPGGVLVGCAAGFVNVPRIKGIHNALRSGMQAAEAAFAALQQGRMHDLLQDYEDSWRSSPLGRDLYPARNVKPLWARFGPWFGGALAGLDLWSQSLFKISPFGTLSHRGPDHLATRPSRKCRRIAYPEPDQRLSFDRLSSVYLTGTYHEEDQPAHLKVADLKLQLSSEYEIFGGLSERYCPAEVYAWIKEDPAAPPRYSISASNCIHCKACDIKDPNQNITWVPPEGGGGPHYEAM